MLDASTAPGEAVHLEEIMNDNGVPNANGTTDGDGAVEAEVLVEDVSIDGMCGVY